MIESLSKIQIWMLNIYAMKCVEPKSRFTYCLVKELSRYIFETFQNKEPKWTQICWDELKQKLRKVIATLCCSTGHYQWNSNGKNQAAMEQELSFELAKFIKSEILSKKLLFSQKFCSIK